METLRFIGGGRVLFCLLLSTRIIHGQTPPVPIWSVVDHDYHLSSAAVTSNGQLIATAGTIGQARIIKFRKASDGTLATGFPELSGPGGELAFSPNGAILAAAGANLMKFWALPVGTEIDSIEGVGEPLGQSAAMSFSPDGQRVVASLASKSSLGVWNTSDFAFLDEWEWLGKGAMSLDFSPDGKWVAAGGGYRALDLSVRVWRASDGALVKQLETANTYNVEAVAFSPDGSLLATGTDRLSNWEGNVELWETANWTLRHRLPGKGYLLAFSPGGEYLVAVNPGNQVDYWSTSTGQLRATYNAPVQEYGRLREVKMLPDGNLLLAGSIYKGDFNGDQYESRLALLPPPVSMISARREGDRLRLNWFDPASVLQIRTDWSGDWMDVPDTRDVTSTLLPMTNPAAFFRVANRAE